MTNPNNAVGTNAAYGGRTSVNAFNDDLSAYSRGVLSGWACAPSSGLTVALGGNGTTRDVAVAEDVTGNKTSINNISGAPIEVTIDAAPASNSRIDVIVAYVDSTLQGSATVTDNYGVCGLITVSGTASASPSAPSESAIRSAITADGAAGATAYYVVLAKITIASGTTDLTTSNISAGDEAKITSDKVDFTTLTSKFSESTIGWVALTTSGINAASITVSKNGKYLLLGQAYFDSSSSGITLDIRKNGSTIATNGSSKTGYFGIELFTVAELSTTDTITLVCTGAGRVGATGTNTHIAAVRIG